MRYSLFYNWVVLDNFFIQPYIEIFLLIIVPLPIPPLVQLLEYIRLIRKEVSSYYYIVTALYMSFFEPS